MTSAPAELRLLLAAARERGVPFPVAWGRALHRCTTGRLQGQTWRLIFSEQAAAWQRAFERQPSTAAELALLVIAGDVLDDDAETIVPDRACQGCGADLEGRRPNVVFCSTACRRRTNYARERDAA